MILTEITIDYKPPKPFNEMLILHKSKDVVAVLRSIWSNQMAYREEVYLLLLNRANALLGHFKLSSGGTSSSVVNLKIIYQIALKSNAHAIILAHNHPSGNLNPSSIDIQLTNKIKEAGKLLDISLLDHLILTLEDYYSFADEGRI